MNNPHATKLAKAAERYRSKYSDTEAQTVIKQDFEDLMSIAQMIEDGANPKTIMTAMWKLDTLVRDEIPDTVYYAFNK
jgi:hypothetical protein